MGIGRVMCWMVYAYVVFHLQKSSQYYIELGSSCKFLFTFTAFFIVFRLNGAYHRYCAALVTIQEIVDATRNIVSTSVACMDMKSPASNLEDILRVAEWKVDVIRFVFIHGFTLTMQNRLRQAARVGYLGSEEKLLTEFDLIRTRGLLYEHEYEIVKRLVPVDTWDEFSEGMWWWKTTMYDHTGSIAQCSLPNWALQQLRHRIASFTVDKHGPVERTLNVLSHDIGILQKHSTKITMHASVPVSLDYLQMTKFLLNIYFVLFPFHIPSSAGLFVNLFFPSILCIIFLGMDLMSTDMENPFGDDTSDLKIATPLHDVEIEVMRLLDDQLDSVKDRFTWHRVPKDDEWLRPRKVNKFLSLKSEEYEVQRMDTFLRTDF